MASKHLHLIYFSPSGGTRRVVRALKAGLIASGLSIHEHDITTPESRMHALSFNEDDIVFAAVPVFFGRVPLCLQTLSSLKGNGAKVVPMVVYGNRAYEDALREWRDILVKSKFNAVAAGAFIAQHSQCPELAQARPDESDRYSLLHFAKQVLSKVIAHDNSSAPLIPGEGEYRPYGVVPAVPSVIHRDRCHNCGECVEKCPMGIIDPMNFVVTDPESCIGCRACMAYCPDGARGYPEMVAQKIAQVMNKIYMANKEPKSVETFL